METEALLTQVLEKLDSGVSVDWTDIRTYIVITMASLIGSIIGAFFTKFAGKRGEIHAIKQDLDEITAIQEEIKSKIGNEAFVAQKLWDLKREVYWDITKALNAYSDALWNLTTHCFNSENAAISDPDIYIPYASKLMEAIDRYLELTGVSHIVMCEEAKLVLDQLANNIKVKEEDVANKKFTYEEFMSMRKEVGKAYDSIVSIAKNDLSNKSV